VSSPLYVYGVLAARDAAGVRVEGVAGAGVRTVTHGEIAALVSEVHGEALAAPREVRAHWRVLEEVSAKATILPVRFATVMESEDALREQLLEPRAERLSSLLEELAGHVQLSVKGLYEEERLLHDVVQGTPEIARVRAQVRNLPDSAGYYDRIRLGELVSAEVERRRRHDSTFALERLQGHAVAAREEEATGAQTAFNTAFLVERGRIDEFSRAVTSLREELSDRINLRYVGPLPPYSFVDSELDGSAAWA
jgi:hypothetical protein